MLAVIDPSKLADLIQLTTSSINELTDEGFAVGCRKRLTYDLSAHEDQEGRARVIWKEHMFDRRAKTRIFRLTERPAVSRLISYGE